MKLLVATALALCVFCCGASAQVEHRFVADSPEWTLLAPERTALKHLFGDSLPETRFQISRRKNGSTTILLSLPYSLTLGSALFAIAPDGAIQWSNYAPIPADSGHLTGLAADDKGQVLVIWGDDGTKAIKARLFDAQGKVIWTKPIAHVSGGEEYLNRINVLFWPKRGWVVAYSTTRNTVVQLLDDKGAAQWGEGTPLVSGSQADNPVSLMQDTPDSVFALWYEHGFMKQPPTASLFRAQRIDDQGHAIWPTPVAVGEAPDFSMTIPRQINLALLPDARVRADLYRGVMGDAVRHITEYQAFISHEGRVSTEDIRSPDPKVAPF